MSYDLAIAGLFYLRDMPCKAHWEMATIFSGAGFVFGTFLPDPTSTVVALTNLAIAIVGVIGALRAMKREDAANRRRDAIVESQLREALGPVSRRQDISDRAIRSNRNKLVKMGESVKGLETMKQIWGVKDTVGRPCLLLVDDDPATLRAYTAFARVNLDDPCVIQAMSVDEALLQIKKLPQWIFLDLKIGDRSGLEIIPHAKSYNPDVQVVIITGINDPSSISAAVAMGVEVLGKPPDKDKLFALIKRMRRDFGVPPKSSDSIPVVGASSILPGIGPDD